jgi:sugar phosphate isomerase/epimerase
VFKLGFSTIGCPDYTVDQVVALAKQNGYAGIEIRFLRGTTDLMSLPEFSPAGLPDTRRRFTDAGIDVVGINTSVRMNSLAPEARDKARALARANLAIAEGLGAKYLRVFGGPLPPEQDHEKTLDAIAEGLGEIADMTAGHGVESLIETHDAFCKADSILDLYRRGASGTLGVLWDTLHNYRHGDTAKETWAKLGGRIKLVHVKDAYKATPTEFDFALTGEGTIPIPSFIEVLKAADYGGYVNFEWEKGWHREIAEPEIAIPHFMRYMAGRL